MFQVCPSYWRAVQILINSWKLWPKLYNQLKTPRTFETTTLSSSTVKFSTEDYYKQCREWLLTAGGRKLWELDMDWGDQRVWSECKSPLKLKSRFTFRTTTIWKLFGFKLVYGTIELLLNTQKVLYSTSLNMVSVGCRLMRQIASDFAQYNVTTFHEYYPFADQYLELKPALFRNCVLAIICMMFVAFMMIPNLAAGLAILVAIVSIDIGVLGYMSLWGVNLESVSMITVSLAWVDS